MLKVFSNWHYQIDTLLNGGGFFNRCVWPGMSKLPKITSLLFLYNILRKKWVMQLIFYMQISMTACYKLILRFFDGYGQAFSKFPEKQVCNVFGISSKMLEMKLTFLMQINIKFPNSWFQHFGHQSFLQCDRHDHENVKDMVMGMIKHSQSTQSNKFAMSLQYL